MSKKCFFSYPLCLPTRWFRFQMGAHLGFGDSKGALITVVHFSHLSNHLCEERIFNICERREELKNPNWNHTTNNDQNLWKRLSTGQMRQNAKRNWIFFLCN